jgi:hypothetical protein
MARAVVRNVVSRRRARASTETAQTEARSSESRSLKTTHFSSGVQQSPATDAASISVRSGPPSGGISRIATVPRSCCSRVKAIQRSFGDQAGLDSAAALVVRRSGGPVDPIC